jgi:hypothetical protein
MNSDIEFLKKQGFFWVKQSSDGTYQAQYNKTVYFGLYVHNNVVRQR